MRARGPLEAATQRAGVGGRRGALAARLVALVLLVPAGTAVALPPFSLSGLAPVVVPPPALPSWVTGA